jgi:hypothetical protein
MGDNLEPNGLLRGCDVAIVEWIGQFRQTIVAACCSSVEVCGAIMSRAS